MEASNKRAIDRVIQRIRDNGIDYQAYDDLLLLCRVGLLQDRKNKYEYKYYLDYVKEVALDEVTVDSLHANIWRGLYWQTVKDCSFYFFEDFLNYMEMKRPYEKKFYEPRKKSLKKVVDDLQKLEDSSDQIFYGLSLPARVGKSTTILFFLAWVALRKPESHSAIGTHSGVLAKHFYKELLDLFTTSDYTFEELYAYFQPGKEMIADKSAEELTISFVTAGDFPTITCRGIDGTWTGAVDISGGTDFGYLAVDDLVRDRQHSLSPKRMNDTFSEMLNKMFDRLNDGAKIMMIGTLWNVMDPLMRLEDMYTGDNRYVFRKIPALDENNESNFDYAIKGFSTEYYREMKERLIKAGNEAEWFAKYQQAPYVREGILFAADEIRMFNGILPQGHNFKYVTVCDVAFGGGDSVSMPIGLQDIETKEIYIIDWYFSSMAVKATVPGVVDMLMKYGIMEITFEANSGGQLYASKIQEELKARNYMCSCGTKRAPWNVAKEDKIKGCEPDIKSKIIFLDGTKHTAEEMGDIEFYNRSAMYERALNELTTFVTIGKNAHDDAADSIAQLCIKAFDSLNTKVEVIDRTVLGF